MVLTAKQKEELNRAILEYLINNDYKQAAEVFGTEAQTVFNKETNKGVMSNILEKKWVSVVRLQKKIMDLE